MESQVFSPDSYSLRPVDLIPDDDFEDDDLQWLSYCEEASQIDPQHILEVVSDELSCTDSPLMDWIADALRNPHEPGRARANITDLAKLGQSLLNMIAKAVDDQVNLRMAAEVGR